MVKALHGAGIEVVLDVVYNHTNEVDDVNPYTTSFRGIDNKVYYMLDLNNKDQMLNFSGCGLLNITWMGFDLTLLVFFAEGTDGTPLNAPPLIKAIAKDSILSRCKIIAEPRRTLSLSCRKISKLGQVGRMEWNISR